MTDPQRPAPDPTALPAPEPDETSDADLILRVRAGDSAAYEQLFRRHRDVAIRYARRLADAERAEDLCAEAFTKILDLLQRGKGPDVAFRAYLLTTVRTSHLNTIRSGSREELVPDHEPIARMTPTIEDPDARFDASAICRAFSKLPERWQAALWLTSVEGLSNEEASRHLGVKVNAVASLAFRARAGLRQAYLSEHLLETTDPQCRRIIELLPSYLRKSLTPRRRVQVDEHLSTCVACTTAAVELSDVDERLGAVLLPAALLGGVALSSAPVVIPATASSLTALASASLGGSLSAVKSAAAGALAQIKAGGAALSGVATSKIAVAATVTVVGVAVGADVVLHDDAPERTDHVRLDPRVQQALQPPRLAQRLPFPPTPTPTPGTTSTAPVEIWVAEPADGGPPATIAPVSVVTSPTPRPSAAPTPDPEPAPAPAAPTPSPTATSTPPPTPAPGVTPRMSVGEPTSQSYTKSGLRWEQVTLPVSNPRENTFLTITTTRTYNTALATTGSTGWVCGTPVASWFDGGFYATSTIRCMHTGNGDSGPLRFDYRVVRGSLFTAELTPPAGAPAGILAETYRQLLLRS